MAKNSTNRSKKSVTTKNKNIVNKNIESKSTSTSLTENKSIKNKNTASKNKQRAIENSRKANKKEITAKKRKREATRVIPVDKILEAQRQAEKKAREKQKQELKNNEKITSKQPEKSKSEKNKKEPKLKLKVKDSTKKNSKKIKKSKPILTSKSKKIKKSKPILTSKSKKIYIGIMLACILILIVEGIYFLIIKQNINNKSVYYDTLNSLTLDKTDIVAVGSSNFKNSKYNAYTKGLEKAKLVKYDKNGTIIFEKMYNDGINSTYNDIIEVNDGYVVVGSYEKDEEQTKSNVRDALIVKYDKDGNIIWQKTFTSLSNSKFNKVVEVEDGYVVIGQSIYAAMEMGNSDQGGGVIIKYSTTGEVMWTKFHGGTKSGSFNGVTIVDGSFYVVGRDGTDFGNLVKYSSDGEYEWHHNYRYTDTLGLSDIAYADGKLYAVGSKEIFDKEVTDDDERNTTNTDALLICYNLNGEIEFEKTFGGSNQERYNSIMAYHNNLFVIGSSNSKDSGLRIFTDGTATTGILVKYDLSGSIERKTTYGGSNQDNLTDIVTDNSNLYITSYTNSKDGNIILKKDNGKDYHGRLIKVDSRLRILFLK